MSCPNCNPSRDSDSPITHAEAVEVFERIGYTLAEPKPVPTYAEVIAFFDRIGYPAIEPNRN